MCEPSDYFRQFFSSFSRCCRLHKFFFLSKRKKIAIAKKPFDYYIFCACNDYAFIHVMRCVSVLGKKIVVGEQNKKNYPHNITHFWRIHWCKSRLEIEAAGYRMERNNKFQRNSSMLTRKVEKKLFATQLNFFFTKFKFMCVWLLTLAITLN